MTTRLVCLEKDPEGKPLVKTESIYATSRNKSEQHSAPYVMRRRDASDVTVNRVVARVFPLRFEKKQPM